MGPAPTYQDVSLARVGDSHQYMDREIEAYSEHIRNLFADVPALQPKYVPITKENFFTSLQDGVLLAHIINTIKANTVNLSKLNTHVNAEHLQAPAKADEPVPKEHTKDLFEATNNLNIVLENAKQVAVVVNVGADDFIRKRPDLVLGVVWQLIRAYLLSDVNVPSHPQLIRLLAPGESLTALIGLTNEQVLLRWFNYHLTRSGSEKRIANFGKDLADSEAYMLLLQQIAPGPREDVKEILEKGRKISENDKEARAKVVLEAAEKLGCRKFVTVTDIVNGHARLNLAFVATIFSKHIGIHLPTEEQGRAMVDDNAVLKARVAELEAIVARQSQQLEDNHQAHTSKVAELESRLASETTSLQATLAELQAAKDAATTSYDDQVAQLKAQIEALQEEQARTAQSQKAFRKQVGSRLGMVRSMLADHMAAVKQDSSLAAKLNRLLGGGAGGTDKGDLPPTSPIATHMAMPIIESSTMEEELEYLSDELQAFVKEVLDENREQKKIMFVLASQAEQNEKVNSLMGNKIREYTEHQIALNPVKEKRHKDKEAKDEKHKEKAADAPKATKAK
ncbi:calponin homology domain-containing protein [Phlyctochytrium arcticum]|nr:calponin homology domain-containing protein [Phlyctochytrium arcticum]